MYDDFDSLITDFKRGKLTASDLKMHLSNILSQQTGLSITFLLEKILQQFANNKLSAEQYRTLSVALTEQNIHITQERNHAEDKESLSDAMVHTEKTLLLDDFEDHSQNLKTLLLDNDKTQIIDNETMVLSAQEKDLISDDNQPLTLGTVLKNRFVLTEVIGKGGMGFVYKARDLVKVEAHAKDPYVAIKVLSERFKKHSGAFIALQREASKSQKLAHPNIATVYDFDYDGKTVFMTMELMRGQPLDKFIKRIPEGGLPLQQAMHYITQICSALAYAHKQKLIHSDLKPANIFLNDNGVVKLLDFGITRAIKTEAELEEKTLFDPASLKALTPAYATIEMFNGESPDPKDDIYALACVAYELLSGVHPYKKVAAHKAHELELKPPPIKKLSRRQQSALNKALKLTRSARTPTVEHFLNHFTPGKSHTKELIITSILIIGIGSLFLWTEVNKKLKEDAYIELITSIKNGDREKLIETLDTIDQTDQATRLKLTSVLRKQILNYYVEKINDAINPDIPRYDFPKAFDFLEQVKLLYPDSALLARVDEQLQNNKKRVVDTLTRRYHEFKKSGDDTSRIVSILKEADPNNIILQQQNE